MKRMKYLAVAAAAVLLQVLAAQAAKYTWVGPLSGGSWTDPTNWSPNTGYPGYNKGYEDRAVFAPGDGVTLTVDGKAIGRFLDVSNGHVVVVSPASGTYHEMYRATSVYVNEGAILELTGARFKSYNDNSNTFTKNGKGLFNVQQLGSNASKGTFTTVTVNAGTMRISGAAYGTNFVVKTGGVLEMSGSSSFAGMDVGDALVSLAEGGTLLWNSSAASEFAGVFGAGEIRGTGTGTMSFNLSRGPLTFSGIADGPKIALTNSKGLPAESFTYTVDGGVMLGGSESNKMNVVTDRRLPTGIRFTDSSQTGVFCLKSGEVAVNGSDGRLPKRIEALGGTLTVVRGAWSGAAATVESPSELFVNGARLLLSGRNGATTGSAYSTSLFAQDAYAKFEIGEKGMSLATVDTFFNGEGVDNVGYTEATFSLFHPLEGDGTNPRGPVEIRGYANWNYYGAFADGGAVSLVDGHHLVCDVEALAAADGAFFGTGDLRLRGSAVGLSGELSSTTPLKLATGTGAALTYEDNAGVLVHAADGDTVKHVQLGALRRGGKGDVLFFVDNGRTIGAADGSTVTLATAPTVNDLGVVQDPLFQSCNGNKQANVVLPFKYDAAKGLVSMSLSDFTEGMTDGAYCKVTTAIYPSVNRALRGLCVAAKVGLAKMATLTIGDGTHPAFVTFHGTGSDAFPDGSGCVNFGTSEGLLFFINNYGDGGVKLGCRLLGSNGIGFCAPPEELCAAYAQLRAKNEYTGGTRINGTVVGACAEGCFGEDDVYVNGGEFMGGAVWFETAGTWANGFHVRGFGRRKEKYNADPFGAMVFKAATTLTGDVELREPTRMCVWTDVDSRITGAVSGDKLILYSFDANKGGVLELAGHNTYTGGTEVVQQSVAICEQDGFGTGPVRAEKSTLAFRNPSAITVPNAMSGHDVTLRYEGAGAVTLANAADLGVTRVEVTPGEHAFASDFTMRPLVSTAEKPRKAAVLVLKAGATYTLSQDDLQGYFDIVLEDGAMLDLGGEELTVCRFTGNRANVNGTIVETNPKGGVLLIVR